MRVAAYNVLYGTWGAPERIGEMLKPLNLDVVGFSEVPDGDWTARVGKVLGMDHAHVGRISSANHKDKYKSILSRTPLRNLHEIEVKVEEGWSPSSLVGAETTIRGVTVTIYSLHIPGMPYYTDESKGSAGEYIARSVIPDLEGKPFVMMGDFNSFLGHEPLNRIEEAGGRSVWRDLGIDLTSASSHRHIETGVETGLLDHIVCSRGFRAVEGGIAMDAFNPADEDKPMPEYREEWEAQGKPLSDHRPVWAELRFSPEKLIYENSFEKPTPGFEQIPGKVGMAGRFNGTDSHLSIGELGDHKQLTITLWVKPHGTQSRAGDGYKGLVTSNAWERGVMHFCFADQAAQCHVHLGEQRRSVARTSALPRNKWTHIALVVDIDRDTLGIYTNGMRESEESGVGSLDAIHLTQQVIGGEHVGTLDRYFKGLIDEVRIYDRVLSPGEIGAMCPGAPVPSRDPRSLALGQEIPSRAYCDQPYIVVTPEGKWVATMTTGVGHEGASGQTIVASRSTDLGRTWSDLVDIEPVNPERPASWVTPLITPYGRIYAFYTYNTEAIQALPDGQKIRADTIGDYCYRYSDDEGRSWSERFTLPMRATRVDRENEWEGKPSHKHFWGISKPQIDNGEVFIMFTKLRRYFLVDGEGWLFKSDNVLTERNPEKIRWTLLPEGEEGIRNPSYPGIPARWGSIQEEHNMVALNDGKSLFCVYRTTLGFPAQSYSRDRGRTWERPTQMVYAPGGPGVKNPRACAKLWKCSNGKYLFWFHNNGTHGFSNRNPAWILGGVERDGFIHWSQPEILLFDSVAGTGFSYPDLVEQDGRYWVTETQKTTARVHEIDPALLEGLWNQGASKNIASKGLLLDRTDDQLMLGEVDLPEAGFDVLANEGLTLDLWVDAPGRLQPGEALLDSRDGDGAGILVEISPDFSLAVTLDDGEASATWTSNPGILTDGSHHVVAILEANPRIGMMLVDGVLQDGGRTREFGWERFDMIPENVRGRAVMKVHAAVPSLRIYDRALRPSEAVSNFNADKGVRLRETTDRTVRENPNFPVYHFMSNAHWLGEANGPLYYKGWYHMFHQQFLPDYGINWGHARSRDLVDWERLPPALTAQPDENHCFSGAAFITDAGPRLIYTSQPSFNQRAAKATDDDLVHWEVQPGIAMPHSLHAPQKIGGWRDAQIIDREGEYYCIIGGSDQEKGRGVVTLFRARNSNLTEWEYLGAMFYMPDSPDCAQPALFHVGDDKWVLFVSRHRPHVEDWFVGRWNMETHRFEPISSGALGYNEATYGTHGLYHPEDGRPIYWNTHHNWRRSPGRFAPEVWPGALSLPRVISVSEDNELLQEPLPELLERIRGERCRIDGFTLQDAHRVLDVEGDTLEIRVTIHPRGAKSFGMTVRRSEDGARGIVLRYSDTFRVDGEELMYSIAYGKENDPVRKPFALEPGEPLELVVFLDNIVFEAYVNKRQCYDRVIHAVDHNADRELALPLAGDLGIEVFSEEGAVEIDSIDIWGMKPISIMERGL